MKFGLFAVNSGALALDPSGAIDVALAAEDAGWESVWTGEHYALSDPAAEDSPAPPATPMLDAWIQLGAIAARTTRLIVGTGVTIAPYHHPVALAKRAVTLDRVSGGRFIFGLGVGYLKAEFAALGLDRSRRGEATEESLIMMRELWETGTVDGTYLGAPVNGIRCEPRPLSTTGPTVVLGGDTDAAFKRAARHADGFYAWMATPERVHQISQAIGAERERLGKSGPFSYTATAPRGIKLDSETIAAYAAVGVTRMVVLAPGSRSRSVADLVEYVGDPGLPGLAH